MTVTVDELLALIGAKEVEIAQARKELAAARADAERWRAAAGTADAEVARLRPAAWDGTAADATPD